MEKRKLIIKPDIEFLEVTKQALDKEIKGTAKDNFLTMTTKIEDESIIALVVSSDKEGIENFVESLMKYYDAKLIEV